MNGNATHGSHVMVLRTLLMGFRSVSSSRLLARPFASATVSQRAT